MNSIFKVNPMINIKNFKVADEEYEKLMWLTEEEFEALLVPCKDQWSKS